jgi:secondary thiamine-phosphate synthase enzyme
MAQSLLLRQNELPWLRAAHARVELRTERPFQLVDITAVVAERVRHSGVLLGTVSVQVLHTTAAVFVNENEPRLLEDVEDFLRRLAPPGPLYRHDQLDRREGPVAVDEPLNGHAHLQALLLPSSVLLNVVDGALDLGRWQSLFLAELDGPRTRGLSIVASGTGEPEARPAAAAPRARLRRREEAL